MSSLIQILVQIYRSNGVGLPCLGQIKISSQQKLCWKLEDGRAKFNSFFRRRCDPQPGHFISPASSTDGPGCAARALGLRPSAWLRPLCALAKTAGADRWAEVDSSWCPKRMQRSVISCNIPPGPDLDFVEQ